VTYPLPDPLLPLLVLPPAALLWAGPLPAATHWLRDFAPFLLAWLRRALSSLLFRTALGLRGDLRRLTAADWRALLGLGLRGYGGTIGLQTLGTAGTTGASAAVLGSTGPLAIALLAPLILGERPGRQTLLGLLLALAGVALVLGLDPRDLATDRLSGDLLVLMSAACFAALAVLGKGTMARHPPLVVSGVTAVGGALGLFPLALVDLAHGLPQPGPLGWSVVVYLGGLITFVGMVAWFWALRVVPAARGGAFLFLQPVSGVALAALVLGDQLTPLFLVGTALVMVGLALGARD